MNKEGRKQGDRSMTNLTDDFWKLAEEYKRLKEEVKQLRRDMEGLQVIWNYLDPKGYAWEEEEFVAILKEYGFYGEGEVEA